MAVEPLPSLRSGPRSTDLSEPILRALADGVHTTAEIAAQLRCPAPRLFYYLEPLAWRLRVISMTKAPRQPRGGLVCTWTLLVPLDVALEALRLDVAPKTTKEPAPAPNNTASNDSNNDSNNTPPAQEAQPQELVEALEAEPPKIIEEPKPAPPQVKPLTRAQLAARLGLIKSRHQALIAEGRIKTKRRHQC